jgi:hypothetical protein
MGTLMVVPAYGFPAIRGGKVPSDVFLVGKRLMKRALAKKSDDGETAYHFSPDASHKLLLGSGKKIILDPLP